MPSMIYLVLRSAHKARLEARTTPMQALIRGLRQFLHNLSDLVRDLPAAANTERQAVPLGELGISGVIG